MKRRYEASGGGAGSSEELPVLNRDVATQVAAATRCVDLGRLARTSRAWSELARPYVEPCKPQRVATKRREVASRYIVGVIVRALRRSLTLAVADVEQPDQTLLADVASRIGTVRFYVYNGEFPLQVMRISPCLVLDIEFAAFVSDQLPRLGALMPPSYLGMIGTPQATVAQLRDSGAYERWLAALDGGYSEAGALVMDMLSTWLARTSRTFEGGWDRSVRFTAPPRKYLVGDLIYALGPLVAWSVLRQDDHPVGDVVPLQMTVLTAPYDIANVMYRTINAASPDSLLQTQRQADREGGGNDASSLEDVDAWRTRVVNTLWTLMQSEQPRTMSDLFRTLYANVIPSRFVMWRALDENRDASLAQYVDVMERAVGVAPSRWLLDVLPVAFGTRGDDYARDALALANLAPPPPPQSAPITAWDMSLYAGGASRRR